MKLKALTSLFILSTSLAMPSLATAAPNPPYTCHVNAVAVLDNRVHVECPGFNGNGTFYFAEPNHASFEASQLVTMALAAMNRQRPLYIVYDPNDYSAAAFGCATHNCRRPISVRLTN